MVCVSVVVASAVAVGLGVVKERGSLGERTCLRDALERGLEVEFRGVVRAVAGDELGIEDSG